MEGQASRKAGSRLGWTPAGCLAVTVTVPCSLQTEACWDSRIGEGGKMKTTAVDGAAAQLGEWPGSLGQRAPG